MKAEEKKRDARLRAKILMALYVCRVSPSGGISGSTLMDQVEGLMPPRQGFSGEDHALALCRDLVRAGYASEKALGERRRGQAFGPQWVEFAITHQGVLLHEQQIKPDPLVDDDRMLEEGT